MKCPEPGIYRDVPDHEYHSWEAASKHQLDVILEHSPMHLDYQRKHPEPPSPAMKIGSAVHALVLQPDKFNELVAVGEEGVSRRMNAWEPFEKAADPKTAITFEEMQAVNIMADNVRTHSIAGRLLDEPGENEISCVWDDWTTKVRCKCRIDLVRPAIGMLADLKTTRNASPVDFPRSIDQYGYERQGWFYREGYKHAGGGNLESFALICVENEPPFAVAVYHIDQPSMEAGEKQIRRDLNIYRQCTDTGIWYGYESLELIGLPEWKLRKLMA